MKQVASIAVVSRREAILFIRRRDNGKWTLPGGHLNEGEKPLDGAVRELYEETGIDASKKDMEYLGSGTVSDKYLVHSFVYHEPKGGVEIDLSKDPDGEADEHCWFGEDSDSDYTSGIPENVHVPNERNVTLALMGRVTPSDALKLERPVKKMAILNPDAGYTITHKVDGPHHIRVLAEHGGKIVGALHLDRLEPGDTSISAFNTEVDPAHRRRGVASAMYAHAEKVTGLKMKPSSTQSREGRALWEGNETAPQFGKSELAKMAIKDLEPGEPFEDDDGEEAHDYGHLLPPKWKDKLSLHVHTSNAKDIILAKLSDTSPGAGGKNKIGHVTALIQDGSIEPHSELHEDFHGEGLGKAMYEALYAHAYHNMGIRQVVGGNHSHDAGHVHESLARAHKLNYVPKGRHSIYGLDRKPYKYNLDGIEQGPVKIIKADDVSFDFGANVPEQPDALHQKALMSISRMHPVNQKAAYSWVAFTKGKGPRPAIHPDLERHLARFGIVDPAGYQFNEAGRSLARPMGGPKVAPKLQGARRVEQPEALRNHRGLDVDYFSPYKKNEDLASMGITEANPAKAYTEKIRAMEFNLCSKMFPEYEADMAKKPPGVTPERLKELKGIKEGIWQDNLHNSFNTSYNFKNALKKHPKLARELAIVGAYFEHPAAREALFDQGTKEDIVDHVRGTTSAPTNSKWSTINWLESTTNKENVPAVIDAFANGDPTWRHNAIAANLQNSSVHPDVLKEAVEATVKGKEKPVGQREYYNIDPKDKVEYMDRKDVTPEQAQKAAEVLGPKRLMNHPKVPVEAAFNYNIDNLDTEGLHPGYSSDQVKAIADKWGSPGIMDDKTQIAMAYHPNTPKEVLRRFTHPQPPAEILFDPNSQALADEFKKGSYLGGKEGPHTLLNMFLPKFEQQALTDPKSAAAGLAMVMGKNVVGPTGNLRLANDRTTNRFNYHITDHPDWPDANAIVNKYHHSYEKAYGDASLYTTDADGVQNLKTDDELSALPGMEHGDFKEVYQDAAKLMGHVDALHKEDHKQFLKSNEDNHYSEQRYDIQNWAQPQQQAIRGAAANPNIDRETALEMAMDGARPTPIDENTRYPSNAAMLGAPNNPNLTIADLHKLVQAKGPTGWVALNHKEARHALAIQDPDWHHAQEAARTPGINGLPPQMRNLAIPDTSTEKVRQLRDKVEALGGKAHHKKVVENLSPAMKRLINPQGEFEASKLQEGIDSTPATEYHVGDAGQKWAGGQQHSEQDSDVFHVNYTGEHVKKLKEAGVWNTFARVQGMITNPTNHPLGPTTIGWVRHTSQEAPEPRGVDEWPAPPGHVEKQGGIHIDEVQSDLGGRRLTKEFQDSGIHINEEHLSKIKEILWGKRKTAQDLVAEAFIHHHRQDPKNHGLAMHWPSHDMKVHYGSPKDTYTRLPKELGFAEKAGKYGQLTTQTNSNSADSPTHTSKITKAEDYFDQPHLKHKELMETAVEKLSNDIHSPNKLTGHCYVASEALYHLLGGKDAGWVPHHVKHEGEPHWYLKHKVNGAILDPTAGQFKTPVPYSEGRGKGFLTKEPSKRAVELISRIKAGMAAKNDPTLKKGILGAVAGAALAISPGLKTAFDEVNPPAPKTIQAAPAPQPEANPLEVAPEPVKPPKWTTDGLHSSLIPIAHLESSFGQNMNHAPNAKGDYHTAFGPVGFKVSTAHEEWTKSNQLKKLYPGLEDPKAFTDKFKSDWKLYNLLATSHFLRLTHRHGSPEKAAYAWRYGSTAAQGADDSVVGKEPYVMRYRDMAASSGIKKSEQGSPVSIPVKHFSSHPGLKELHPKFQGTGMAGAERGRANRMPRTYYYLRNAQPEGGVTAGSAHQYHGELPAGTKLYDMGKDKLGLNQPSWKQTGMGQMYRVPELDKVEKKLAKLGYNGYHNYGVPGALAYFHPLKVKPALARPKI